MDAKVFLDSYIDSKFKILCLEKELKKLDNIERYDPIARQIESLILEATKRLVEVDAAIDSICHNKAKNALRMKFINGINNETIAHDLNYCEMQIIRHIKIGVEMIQEYLDKIEVENE